MIHTVLDFGNKTSRQMGVGHAISKLDEGFKNCPQNLKIILRISSNFFEIDYRNMFYGQIFTENNISRILGRHTDRFTGKLIQTKRHLSYLYGISIRYRLYRIWFQPKNLMDEFSSKTACVTTRKMKISEKFLDEFSMICQ